MRHRSGATLVEVLVAIFVTAIGLLALLALFPLGALTMAQAIKDDRTATAAANAAAAAEAHIVRQSPWVTDSPPAPDPFINPAIPGSPISINLRNAHSDLPGFPVYVDPIGFQAYTGLTGLQGPPWGWLGGLIGVPRRSLRFIHWGTDALGNAYQRPAAERSRLTTSWFTLGDDMNFLHDKTSAEFPYLGLPCQPNGAVQREGKYSWAYLLKRPRAAESKVVEVTVVVYSSRAGFVSDSTGPILPLGETAYATPQRPTNQSAASLYSNREGKTVLTVSWTTSQERPQVRKGGWVLDASMEGVGSPVLNNWAHGYFYRVVGLTDNGDNTMDLELQTPLRLDVDTITPAHGEAWTGLATPAPARSRTGRVFVLDNVVEVFEKGPGWMP